MNQTALKHLGKNDSNFLALTYDFFYCFIYIIIHRERERALFLREINIVWKY